MLPKKYLGYLVSALLGKASTPVSTLGSRARLAKPSKVQSRFLKGTKHRPHCYLRYFTAGGRHPCDARGWFFELGQSALAEPSWITAPEGQHLPSQSGPEPRYPSL